MPWNKMDLFGFLLGKIIFADNELFDFERKCMVNSFEKGRGEGD
jgi:hypothetical protein